MIPPEVERRARHVLDTLGARDLGFGDDLPSVERAWEQAERGERPDSDELAEAFFYLARLEERVDPHANLGLLPGLGFRYDASLAFADAPGFRAGIAHGELAEEADAWLP